MWYEGFFPAHNVEVASCDIYATPNYLKSQEERIVLSPVTKVHAATLKLWSLSRPTTFGSQDANAAKS